MKETEFRVGNTILYKGVEVNLTAEDFAEFDKNLLDLSKPIPLTEEWLFKFGFELDGEQIRGKYYRLQFAYNSGYMDYISIDDKGSGYMFQLTSNYGKRSILPFNYKYVHTLQNLYFALTGKELEIK